MEEELEVLLVYGYCPHCENIVVVKKGCCENCEDTSTVADGDITTLDGVVLDFLDANLKNLIVMAILYPEQYEKLYTVIDNLRFSNVNKTKNS